LSNRRSHEKTGGGAYPRVKNLNPWPKRPPTGQKRRGGRNRKGTSEIGGRLKEGGTQSSSRRPVVGQTSSRSAKVRNKKTKKGGS